MGPMRNLTKPVIAAAASVLAAMAMTACTATPAPNSPAPTAPATAPADPDTPAPTQVASTSEAFEGKTNDETITANQMQVEVPKGIRIPENALVTKADPNNVMMADEDDAATKAMVEASAAEAGYTVYAEIPGGKVFVGQGNAVIFTSGPGFQMLAWGPESMKDVLAGKS